MRLVSLLLLLVFIGCGDDSDAIDPWPIPITGLDGGLDASVRDAAARDAALDAAKR